MSPLWCAARCVDGSARFGVGGKIPGYVMMIYRCMCTGVMYACMNVQGMTIGDKNEVSFGVVSAAGTVTSSVTEIRGYVVMWLCGYVYLAELSQVNLGEDRESTSHTG